MYYVYAYIDPRNNTPRHIGKGKGARMRRQPSHDLDFTPKSYIHRWWWFLRSIGLEPIRFVVVDNLTEAEAFAWERGLIGMIGRFDLKQGPLFNLTDGGDGVSGCKFTADTRRKLSEAKKGKTLSADHCRKLSEVHKGKTRSKEHCRKLSVVHKGKTRSKEHCRKLSVALKGRTLSEEARRKLSEARRHAPPKGGFKGVSFWKQQGRWRACISVNGERRFLSCFQTDVEAARAYNAAVDKYWGGDGWKNPV